jgi:hypothetical protein
VCQKSDLAWITAISAVTFSSTFAHASIQWLVGPTGGIRGQSSDLLGSRSTSWATWRVFGQKVTGSPELCYGICSDSKNPLAPALLE